MSFSVIIPARYASTRLEGKPLLDIAGKPMIEHVYKRVADSQAERVIIATDDQRIYDTATGFGATVCMTRSDHESGTDRLQEVASQMQMPDDHIVVNVQGDEPLIPPSVINQVANSLANNPQAGMATLVEAISDEADVFNPDIVKAVMDKQGRALYFSRAPIPWNRETWNKENYSKAMPGSETRHRENYSKAMRSSETGHKENHNKATPGSEARCTPTPAVANRDHKHAQHHSGSAVAQLTQHYCRHIGIYAYRVAFLHQFVGWPVSTLETIEKLEQLRALDNGVTIHASHAVAAIPGGVDTREDLEKVRALFC